MPTKMILNKSKGVLWFSVRHQRILFFLNICSFTNVFSFSYFESFIGCYATMDFVLVSSQSCATEEEPILGVFG